MFVKQRAKALTLTAVASAILMGMVGAGNATAASYAKEVRKPTSTGDSIKAKANVNTDCADTFGCYTYMKIERLYDDEYSSSPVPWLNTWQQVAGDWANNGWNELTFTNPHGCAKYRTVVDSYNDAPDGALVGVSLGVIELNLGGNVKRYKQTYTSNTIHVCSYA